MFVLADTKNGEPRQVPMHPRTRSATKVAPRNKWNVSEEFKAAAIAVGMGHGATKSTQSDDWLEMYSDDNYSWPHIVRPASLSFVCPRNCEWMAHFLLNGADISSEPEFPDSASKYFEEYAEAPSGTKFTHSQWDNDDNGDGGSLPSGTRWVLKYWKAGTIAIFAKCSPYNQISLPSFDASQHGRVTLRTSSRRLKPQRIAARPRLPDDEVGQWARQI